MHYATGSAKFTTVKSLKEAVTATARTDVNVDAIQ
jgi:hypothetical protein